MKTFWKALDWFVAFGFLYMAIEVAVTGNMDDFDRYFLFPWALFRVSASAVRRALE